MPHKLYYLKGVSEDEAEEVRDLLNKNNINYYETPGGLWGLSMPAIWLSDDTQTKLAYELLQNYQKEREIRVRNEFEHLRKKGYPTSIIDRLIKDPIRFIIYTLIAIIILYFTIKPFLYFGQ